MHGVVIWAGGFCALTGFGHFGRKACGGEDLPSPSFSVKGRQQMADGKGK